MSDTMNDRPVIDEIDARRLDLIRKTVAKNCTDAEIASFLEIAARYDLDPFAKEIWCAKDDKPNSRVLIMVGRDGLRKVAQRQGFVIDSDVVHEKDTFNVERDVGGRVIRHVYGHPKDRGAISGAWCEVTTETGHGVGFFYAPISEYKPANVSQYSPWSKQTSVMIMAAAERQALRQATPLSGLLAEGEDESARALITAGEGDGKPLGLDLGPDVEKVIARATELGHAGLSDRASIEVALGQQPPGYVAEWCKAQHAELDAMGARAAGGGDAGALTDAEVVEVDREALRDQLNAVLDRILAEEEADADEAVMAPLYAERDRLRGLLGPDEPMAGQEEMDL